MGRLSPNMGEGRPKWPFVLAGAVIVLVVLGVCWSWFVSSLNRPPDEPVPLGGGLVARWDRRASEIIEGLLEVRDGRAFCVVHFATPALPELAYGLHGEDALPLPARVSASPAGDAELARATYLDMLYPRLEDLMRMRWEIDNREQIPAKAANVRIRMGSRLFARLEVRWAPVERDTDGNVVEARREAWVDRILELRELK